MYVFPGSSSNLTLTRNRYSAGSELYTTVDDLEVDAAAWKSSQQDRRLTPIYAVPNKNKASQNKRQTVHVSANLERHQTSAGASNVVGDSSATEHIYSQVDKERKRKKQETTHDKQQTTTHTRHSDYDNIVIPEDITADANRNRIMPKTSNGTPGANGKKTSAVTAGYQTIGSVQSYNPDDLDGGSAGMFDPDYDTVQEAAVVIQSNECDDVDYESIPGSAAAMAMRVAASTSSSASAPQATTASRETTAPADRNANVHPNGPEVATGAEALVHISQFNRRPMQLRRAEHIYEAISDDSAQGNVYSEDPTKHVTRARTQTQQRQFVTNL